MLIIAWLLLPAVVALAPRVLDVDGLARPGIERLKERGALVTEGLGGATLEDAVQSHEAVIVRSATTLTEALIDAGATASLRCIGRAGVGVDNIDTAAAAARGLPVVTSAGASTRAVVELTVAHLLQGARRLADADAAVQRGDFAAFKAGAAKSASELGGKRLGILGFGRIARETARVAAALGMRVAVCSPTADAESAAAVGARVVSSPGELFAECTHVALQCALTDGTRGLVDLDLIRSMPAESCGRHIINVARGGIAVEADVARALATGDLDVYAADVFDDEPGCRDSSPLFGKPGFFATPHIGAATSEAQVAVSLLVADRVMDALDDSGSS